MIVQCEACQTRFRLADEKIKAGGTKVRCSKCKEVFTVMPPEPEPVEEAVDYGSFNMEKVADEAPSGPTATTEPVVPPTPEPEAEPTAQESAPAAAEPPAESTQETEEDVDFSTLESEMGDPVPDDELADEFSFVDTSQLSADAADGEETETAEADVSADTEKQEQGSLDEATNFDDAFSETDEPGGALEFEFNEESDTAAAETAASDEIDSTTESFAGNEEIDFSSEESADTSALSSDEAPEDTQEQDEPGDFAFGDTEEEAQASNESSEPDEFSFDDDVPFEEESSSEWGDDAPAEDTSFDFEEPQFDTNEAPAESPAAESRDDSLQFGEIDFASDSSEDEAPGLASEDDFSKASMELKEEPESFSPSQESPKPPADNYDDEKPLLAPPPPKKSSLSRILVLLVLLLAILGGAAGFLFIQEGTINLSTIGQYLPFLQEYIGEAPASSPGDRIGINVSGSSYVNGTEGQLLVIQGAAVNNHPVTRSSITIKGVLLDAQGQTLLQQTVFCGNQLSDNALKTMSFAAIEEAMNNQFGDSLSNMNVAAGTSIPFTIVFRNLPGGIANINVEVVDSKPGAG
jgi:predicted Zn finger-like uncharacterized protein